MQRTLCFVGERPSKRAARIGATWHNGHLAAKVLHDALREVGVDPQACEFWNLYPAASPRLDDASCARELCALLREKATRRAGYVVIGMGAVVQRVLAEHRVPHLKLVHPAARGSIRRHEAYVAHVRGVLFGEEGATDATGA